ncbi:hypothetical protein COD82_08800 [Bacillus cereus]|nr:hypothetical protein COM93_13390 [Bacillus cereus]RFB63577.1 hypothetical protein DZB82_13380 [Bacillus sp. dmp5]PEA98677.1 hypothetical protein CON57_26485 [Bacillus cereus]PEC32453.1 hypothetical protein COM99_17695 [Bacillus cereus]PED34038.1 hypothetical protein CON13_00860 [Bacillus cereus]
MVYLRKSHKNLCFLIQLQTTKLLFKEMYVHTNYILFNNSLTFVHGSLILKKYNIWYDITLFFYKVL